jgi:hypothetical protein
MSSKITVINRTGARIAFRIGDNNPGTPTITGFQVASGYLEPGVSSGVVIDASSVYMVGAQTMLADETMPTPGQASLMVYNVFPNAMVTFATELGTRPDPDEVETDEDVSAGK